MAKEPTLNDHLCKKTLTDDDLLPRKDPIIAETLPRPIHKRWEYKIVTSKEPQSEQDLNTWGLLGWLLTSKTQGMTLDGPYTEYIFAKEL